MTGAFLPSILLAVLLVTPSLARSDDGESERGRLPDGRAFRTDVAGNEIVDYIAELEVSIEQLNRRIYGLEEEVKTRDSMLARIPAEKSCPPPVEVKERSIKEPPTVEIVKPVVPDARYTECQSRLEGLLSMLEDQKGALSKLQSSVTSLEQRNDELARELSTAKSVQRVERVAQVTKSDQEARASLSYQRSSILDTTRARVVTEINQVAALVSQRDDEFRKAFQQINSLRVAPTKAVGPSGLDVHSLRTLAASAQGLQEITKLRREAQTIARKMKDDLALVRRIRGGTVSPTSRTSRAGSPLQ